MTDTDGLERAHHLVRGGRLAIGVAGQRRCVGLRRGTARGCPFDAAVPAAGRDAQCAACAAADPGRVLARDGVVDPRTFRLYLAAFGSGPLKVGISAVDRGSTRLLEQGALAFNWIAQGPHTAIRAAESMVSTAGIATERRRREGKLTGWWQPGTPRQRVDDLLAATSRAHRLPTWPTDAQQLPPDVVDHVDIFGLRALPDHLYDIEQIRDGATIIGQLLAVVGTELLLRPANEVSGADEVLVVSGKVLAGWPVSRADTAAGIAAGGYNTIPVRNVADRVSDDAAQRTLF